MQVGAFCVGLMAKSLSTFGVRPWPPISRDFKHSKVTFERVIALHFFHSRANAGEMFALKKALTVKSGILSNVRICMPFNNV
jgi:hypothetical protein